LKPAFSFFYFLLFFVFDVTNFFFPQVFHKSPARIDGGFPVPLTALQRFTDQSGHKKTRLIFTTGFSISFKSKLPFRLYVKCPGKQREADLQLTGFM